MVSASVPVPLSTVQRSARVHSKPGYLKDFHCTMASSTCLTSPHALSKVITYDALSPSYRAFALSVSVDFEPQFFHQAVQHEH